MTSIAFPPPLTPVAVASIPGEPASHGGVLIAWRARPDISETSDGDFLIAFPDGRLEWWAVESVRVLGGDWFRVSAWADQELKRQAGANPSADREQEA